MISEHPPLQYRFSDQLPMLNPPQRAAIEYTEGSLLVLAGAGSGKTRVIVEKFAYLIERLNLPAQSIAAITFTNKAAREMRQRIGKRLGTEPAEGLQISTFHALGLRILQLEHVHAGLKRNFSVLDADDTLGLLKDLSPAACKPEDLQTLRTLLSRAKNAGLDPCAASEHAATPKERQAAELYVAYQRRLTAYNALDFDDLIRLPLQLLENHTELALNWRQRLRYLLVDEYQDTNEAQYRLLKALAGPRGAFTCVGDDDQSIYAWRGARPENLSLLGQDYPGLRVIKLEQNYRCPGRILRAANALIARNDHLHPKRLWSEREAGPPIRVLACRDAEHEAERIASRLIEFHERYQVAWNEQAVLYRGNHQARALEKALRLARVPYRLSGALSFLDRAEVKDVLAYLRLIANPEDDAAFLRVVNLPRREIGAGSLEKFGLAAQVKHLPMLDASQRPEILSQLATRQARALAGFAELIRQLRARSTTLSAAQLLDEVLARSGYGQHLAQLSGNPSQRQRRRANLAELGDWFRSMQKGTDRCDDLTQQLALLGHTERDDAGNAVRLMTLHASKGLEFRCVFIVGVEEGTLPHESAIDEGHLDEERRLFYVGLTRAQEWLTLSYAARVRRWGEIMSLQPSRFLEELPTVELHWDGRDPAIDAAAQRQTALAHLERLKAMLQN